MVDAPWLDQRLAERGYKIVDPRTIIKYLGGHIPGAISLPVSKIFDQNTLELKPEQLLAEQFGEAGIDTDTTVVLYDSFDGQSSAMLAWVLEYLGHEKVKILSSFIEAWAKDGRDLLYRQVKPEPARFQARLTPAVRATLREVVEIHGRKLVDLRSREEFDGRLTSETRAGHVPGAISLPWTDLLGQSNEFLRSKPELEKAVGSLGLRPTDQIVTYCNYGPRAALGYIALRQLGYESVRVYDGSFHQWALHPELLVEAGGEGSTKSSTGEWASYVLPGC